MGKRVVLVIGKEAMLRRALTAAKADSPTALSKAVVASGDDIVCYASFDLARMLNEVIATLGTGDKPASAPVVLTAVLNAQPDRMRARMSLDMGVSFSIARVRRVQVAVEHEARPSTGTGPGAEDIRPPVLDLLPLHLEAHVRERLRDELRERLLGAGEARGLDRPARPVDEPVAVDRDRHEGRCRDASRTETGTSNPSGVRYASNAAGS